MKKTFKKAFAAAAAALSVMMAVPMAANAYGVTGEDFYYTNRYGTHISSCGRNQTVYVTGKLTYDATLWGWIPAPSTCYYNLETPYYSLNKPYSVSGSWSSGSFTYAGYSSISGSTVYRFSKSFSAASKQTKTVTATTSSKSYATGWNTGSVNTGSGHDSDGSALGSFKTN